MRSVTATLIEDVIYAQEQYDAVFKAMGRGSIDATVRTIPYIKYFEFLQRAVGYIEENKKTISISSNYYMCKDPTGKTSGVSQWHHTFKQIISYLKELRPSILNEQYIKNFNSVLKKLQKNNFDCSEINGQFMVEGSDVTIRWALQGCVTNLSSTKFIVKATSSSIPSLQHESNAGVWIPLFSPVDRVTPQENRLEHTALKLYDAPAQLFSMEMLRRNVPAPLLAEMLKKQFNESLQRLMMNNEARVYKLNVTQYNAIMPKLFAIADRYSSMLDGVRFGEKEDGMHIRLAEAEWIDFVGWGAKSCIGSDKDKKSGAISCMGSDKKYGVLLRKIDRGTAYRDPAVAVFLKTYSAEDLQKITKEIEVFIDQSIHLQEERAIDYIKEVFPVETMRYYLEKSV